MDILFFFGFLAFAALLGSLKCGYGRGPSRMTDGPGDTRWK